MNVLVTGASSGIGAALARILASQGHRVAIVARRADRLAQVRADCGPTARMWACDLSDTDAAVRVALEAWDAFGGLGALVNNAGVPMRRHTTQLDPATLEWVMRVNFLSPAAIGQALLPRMLARGSGAIVHVSSVAGRIGNANEAAYSASRFALCGWAEATAVDLWDTPIKIRLVNPGPIDTEIWDLPGNDEPLYHGPKVAPEQVAAGIIAVIEGEAFEHYLPDMKPVVDMKQRDIDGFLAGMSAMLVSARSADTVKALVSLGPRLHLGWAIPGGKRMRACVRSGSLAPLALVLCIACVPVPGGRLGGSLAPAPSDWSAAIEGGRGLCEIESRPADPHSIQLECFLHDGDLFVQSHRWALAPWWPVDSWAAIWIEHPEVRVRLGEQIFELRAVRVTDTSLRDAMLRQRGYDPVPEGIALFRFEPRS